MLRAPARIWEWVAVPILYLALIGLGGYLAGKLSPHPMPVIGAVALFITSALAVVAALVAGLFAYRSYTLATPHAARRFYKAMNSLQWCYAANVLAVVLLTGMWIALAFPVSLLLSARLSRARSPRN